jgi:ATPase subunit of ABC transporter with duplicated ATPase domains
LAGNPNILRKVRHRGPVHLRLEKARKAHGDKVVLDNVTLNFLPGAKIGVVGPNGAGKSSLLRIMAGSTP